MWFFFALTFAIASSFSTIIAKHVMREMDEYAYLLFTGIVTMPFLLAIILYFYQIPRVDSTFFLSLAAATAIGVVGAILAYRAIKISEISLVSPISAFNPVFTAIISFFALGEKIGPKGALGILLIVTGAYLLQVSKTKKGIFAPLVALATHKGVQLSFVAYFIWAVTPTFEKTAIFHTNPQVPPFASLVGMAMSTIIYGFLALKYSSKPIDLAKKYFRFFLLVGLLGGIGMAAAFTAFSLANLGFVTAIFKLSIIFTVILGWLFFKEKDIKDRLLGSLVMLAGVVLLVT